MEESKYIKPFFHVRKEHSDGTVIETMHDPHLPKYVWVAIWDLYDENTALEKKITQYERLLSGRAGKLLKKGKFFLVVAEDEPYFKQVYQMIREREIEIGRWTEEDEEQFNGLPMKTPMDEGR